MKCKRQEIIFCQIVLFSKINDYITIINFHTIYEIGNVLKYAQIHFFTTERKR